jgi:predicted phage terminase large subunit-like protein
VVLLDPASLTGGKWLDSWDLNFGGTGDGAGSYVVGQRWVRSGPNRFLIAQQRKRWSFSETLAAIKRWAGPPDPSINPYGRFVHQTLIEKKANGAAIIDVLQKELAGIKPVNPTASKEVRARSVTPEIESGHVYLPHPSDPGNGWVNDFLSEVRNFPHDSFDDQCLTYDTLVESPQGAVRLGEVRVGDIVRGETGWVTVENAGMTSASATVIENLGLTGTPAHPIWTMRGWIPLAQVRAGDLIQVSAPLTDAGASLLPGDGVEAAINDGGNVLSLDRNCLHLYSDNLAPDVPTVENTLHIGDAAETVITRRAGVIRWLKWLRCMGSRFGVILSRTFPRIDAISGLGAPRLLPELTRCTERSSSASTGLSPKGGMSTILTETRSTTPSTTSLPYRRTSIEESLPGFGKSVGGHGMTLRLCTSILIESGRSPANGMALMRVESGTVNTPTEASSSVTPVFNLTTSDGTYFANGILTHNCDSMTQALSGLRDEGRGQVTVPGLVTQRVARSRASTALTDTRRRY